ncbi:MAG: hypothetical protein IJU49_03935 [Lachnospiraceae bacterium]|nr:hypothetical protein [Lachnospiraceae bacterium]
MKDNRLLNRFKTEYDFKTFVTSFISLIVTVIFAVYNGFLGIYHASLWHGTICVYYLVLVLLRGTIMIAERKASRSTDPEPLRRKVYIFVSILLLLLNVALIVPAALMVRQLKPVSLTLVPAISMAAYTTFRIVMASIHLKKRKLSSNCLVRLLRTISFIDALVAILTLQNTLIMVISDERGLSKMLPLTAITSGAVWLFILVLSVLAIRRGIRQIKGRS